MDGSKAGNQKPKPKGSWAFMAAHMPNVVERIKEHRQRGDGAHIDECWRRGVVGLEPGWFWAYEAGVSVGVPSVEMLVDSGVQQLLKQFPNANVVMTRNGALALAGAEHGA
jgi:hypothetical protein